MSLPASDIQYQEEHINDTKQPNLIASSVICLTAAYIAVALRLVARRSARLALAADDYVIILALFFTTAFVAMVLVDVRYGLGKHLILVTDGTSFSKVSGPLFPERRNPIETALIYRGFLRLKSCTIPQFSQQNYLFSCYSAAFSPFDLS